MADASNLIVTGDTREGVAYALLLGIAKHEKKNISFAANTPIVEADADWVLPTYLRCVQTVSGSKV